MRRRPVNVFGLSFLDIMFCGFGSVILLVMIVNSSMIRHREAVNSELKAEADRLAEELEGTRARLAEAMDAQQQTRREMTAAQNLSNNVLTEISARRQQLGEQQQSSLALREHINALQSELQALDEKNKALRADAQTRAEKEGVKLRRIRGDGDRQYLTGIRMGGQRILILVDGSASMLAERIIDIIIRRNQSDAEKAVSRKWRRVAATVEWLLSQLPRSSLYQLVVFNQESQYLLQNNRWLKATDAPGMDRMMSEVRNWAPDKGTSLYQAFLAINSIRPRPDNVFLLTDGLPTLGRQRESGRPVTGEQRLDYFDQALKILPGGIPVNTILFQIEGDPMSAPVFWKLAVQSKGSLVVPAKDWP